MQQQRDKMPQKCTSEATGVFLSSNITPCTEYTSMLYVVYTYRGMYALDSEYVHFYIE